MNDSPQFRVALSKFSNQRLHLLRRSHVRTMHDHLTAEVFDLLQLLLSFFVGLSARNQDHMRHAFGCQPLGRFFSKTSQSSRDQATPHSPVFKSIVGWLTAKSAHPTNHNFIAADNKFIFCRFDLQKFTHLTHTIDMGSLWVGRIMAAGNIDQAAAVFGMFCCQNASKPMVLSLQRISGLTMKWRTG